MLWLCNSCGPKIRKEELANRRKISEGYARGKVPSDVLCGRYDVQRLITRRLDLALSRLPYSESSLLAQKRVAIIGCGALGSGVARLLAKAGIGHLLFVDGDLMGWENIRRHELGSRHFRKPKASGMAREIAGDIPEIGSVEARDSTIQSLLRMFPNALCQMDLVVSCTGVWAADVAVENNLRTLSAVKRPSAIYGWMEAHAVAAHAVYVSTDGPRFQDGFDDTGDFHLPASEGGKPTPPECGGSTSPFGAIELSAAQSLVARLALDVLRGKVASPLWRTWLADADALAEAEARWTTQWVQSRGQPSQWGGIQAAEWAFP